VSDESPPHACPLCALVQTVPPLAAGELARCARCGGRVHDPRTSGARNARARQATIAALVLYPLAVSLPILRIERLGEVRESSVLGGSLGLLADGELALGLLLFLCSVVVPLVKLLTLLVLLARPRALAAHQRTHAWRALELSGRFGMLDVLLVAILVAWLELGSWVHVEPGPAALSFGACVLCSLLASAWFDPHTLWRDEREGRAA
jgi:paraquat-inducible protein A